MTNFPTLNDPADVTVLVQAVKDYVGEQSSYTAAGFTPAAGWDLTMYSFYRLGDIAQYRISLTRTGGTITVNTKGDIPNTVVGSVIADQRPALFANLSAISAGRGTFGGIWDTGNVHLTSVAGSGDIVNGDLLDLAGIGLLG